MARIVKVTWRDSWTDFDGEPRDWSKEYVATTVGFLVRDIPTLISIAAEELPSGDGYRAITHINRCQVISIEDVWRPL